MQGLSLELGEELDGLHAMLAEIDAQREEITAELRAAEDADAVARRIEAVRYSLVHAEW